MDYIHKSNYFYNPQQAATTPSYTGNITEWTFRHGSDPQTTYAFSYDALSRLTASRQYENGIVSEQFVEKGITYDHNGNILTLQRTASGTLADDLTYTYAGNQLAALSGSVSASFVYDANGNMIQDGANDLGISYNTLNLIEKVSRNGEILANYAYLSDGTKLSATDADGNGLIYAGSLVYRKQNGNLSLESAGFNGGRFIVTNNRVEPHYFLTDHLGSTRTIVNGDGEVIEQNDYYPFGMRWSDSDSQLSDNRYRYNGKEEQSFVGNPYIDYGARMYDPKFRLGWNASDPLAEKYYPISTYAFCANNPVKFVDTDGKKLRPAGTAELNMIRNTVPQDSRQYIILDKKGYIDQSHLELYQGNSQNYNNIKEIVASDITMEVRLDDKFNFADENGKMGIATMSYFPYDPSYPEDKDVNCNITSGLSTGETGLSGKTLFPDRVGKQNSPSNNIIIIVNSKLSPIGAAETYSHEANGHGLLYIRNDRDHLGASHNIINRDGKFQEINDELKNMIIQSRRETINNMQ